MKEKIKSEIIKLRNKSKIAYLASVNDDGYPQIKAMLAPRAGDLLVHYFSTNTSSKRVKQFQKNPKASVYYCNNIFFKGALFTGTIEVCRDYETRALIWRKGDELFYPKGIDDEDYCVLKFTAQTVNYYHGLHNESFLISEIHV